MFKDEQSDQGGIPWKKLTIIASLFATATSGVTLWLYMRYKGLGVLRQMPVIGPKMEDWIQKEKQKEIDKLSEGDDSEETPTDLNIFNTPPYELYDLLSALYEVYPKDSNDFQANLQRFQLATVQLNEQFKSRLVEKTMGHSGADYRGEQVKALTVGLHQYMTLLNFNANPNLIHGAYERFKAVEKSFIAELLKRYHSETGAGHIVTGGTEAIEYALQMIVVAYQHKPLGLQSWLSKYVFRDKPKVLLTEAAHAAFFTKLGLLKSEVDFVVVASDPDTQTMDLRDLKIKLEENPVIAVIASVNYMTGYPDNVPEIAKILRAQSDDIALHVDLCIAAGIYEVQQKRNPEKWWPMDFCIEGVTSISICLHKHFLGLKGASAILFKNPMDAAQRLLLSKKLDWTGGPYVTSGKGSRSPLDMLIAAITYQICETTGHYESTAEKILDYAQAWSVAFNQNETMKAAGFRCLPPSNGTVTFISDKDNGESLLHVAHEMKQNDVVFSGLQKPYRLHFVISDKQVDKYPSAPDFVAAMMSVMSAGLARYQQRTTTKGPLPLSGAYGAVDAINQAIPTWAYYLGLAESFKALATEVGVTAHYHQSHPVVSPQKKGCKKTS